jgi:hypothetical protein
MVQEGLPFLVMELIEGTPIDQYCEEHELAVNERLKLFTDICAAVQFAHQRLVIHLRPISMGGISRSFGSSLPGSGMEEIQTEERAALVTNYRAANRR